MLQRCSAHRTITTSIGKASKIQTCHSSHFTAITHTVRASHIRERPATTELGRESDLRISLKQYIPQDNPNPRPGDVTLVAAHANAFPKELYEPLWDDIYMDLKAIGRQIRGIWIADVVQQGVSGRLNADLLGPDPSWWDHARDLLFMINQFQDEMPSPIMGVGHSMGGFHLAHLSLMHPSLLQSLILIDPVIQTANPSYPYARASTYRRTTWPSRQQAAEKFRSTKFYQAWDPRVLDKWIENGIVELPASTEASADGERPVELATPPAQEVFTFLRPAYDDPRMLAEPDQRAKDMHPEDIDGDDDAFYRPEPSVLMRRLGEIKPNVMYIFGAKSELSSREARRGKLELTGSAVYGNGGVEAGAVEEAVLDCGHLVPMEKTRETAQVSADFIGRELKRWEARQGDYRRKMQGLTREQRVEIGELWKNKIGPPPGRRAK